MSKVYPDNNINTDITYTVNGIVGAEVTSSLPANYAIRPVLTAATPVGYTGSRGDKGFTGSAGRGDHGYSGSRGNAGFVGSKGDKGDIGPAGGYTGSAGTSLETIKSVVAPGTTYTPDYADGTVHFLNATSNFTLSLPINMPVGATLTIWVSQDATGKRKLTPHISYKFAGGNKTLSTIPLSTDMINIFKASEVLYYAAISLRYF